MAIGKRNEPALSMTGAPEGNDPRAEENPERAVYFPAASTRKTMPA
jgi:hypothetical protein